MYFTKKTSNKLLLHINLLEMELILHYFDGLSGHQIQQFKQLEVLYKEWNSKINVISRKDLDDLYLKHVLHSLGIAKVIAFKEGTNILDVGTGGGFPGIPLAIMFPECNFHLVDSIGKKIKVVDAVVDTIGLNNVKTSHSRVEVVKGPFNFIVSRAVTSMPEFVNWIKGKIAKKQINTLRNGILYLKGGDLTEELQSFPKASIYDLKNYFEDEFFETKKVVHLPLKFKG